jgi:ATP-dependent Clp protease, protease subunit
MKTINNLLQLLRDNAQCSGDQRPKLRMEAAADVAHVYVYDVIDSWWGASAAGLIEALAGAGDKTVHLHINSPGGDVFEGRAMAAAIAAHPQDVITFIDGLAASAATYLAMAGKEVRITQGGMLMVHNGWTLGYGNKAELRATADLLQKIDGQIAADYARRTSKTLDQITAWMDAETWFTEDEAMAEGFVDAITPNSQREQPAEAAAARWNLGAFANAPKPEQLPAPDENLAALAAAQTQTARNRLRMLTRV